MATSHSFYDVLGIPQDASSDAGECPTDYHSSILKPNELLPIVPDLSAKGIQAQSLADPSR